MANSIFKIAFFKIAHSILDFKIAQQGGTVRQGPGPDPLLTGMAFSGEGRNAIRNDAIRDDPILASTQVGILHSDRSRPFRVALWESSSASV